uniref:Transposase n=1 Tax=Rhizobium rhizogenes TaxID=359 RepID=A0A2Z2PKR5_RHIRH|nr:hypothetical protein [Rhizobium rhizogenes]
MFGFPRSAGPNEPRPSLQQGPERLQKGAVENANKRIRRFMPGDTDLAAVSQRDLTHLARHLKDQPRKCLG